MLSFNFALSQRLKIDFNIKRRLRFVLRLVFFAVLAHCGRFYGVLAIILYIYTCYALYRVIRLCMRFDCDVQFSGHTVLALGQLEFFCPRFFIFCVLCIFCVFLFSAFSAFSVHKNFLHLNTA